MEVKQIESDVPASEIDEVVLTRERPILREGIFDTATDGPTLPVNIAGCRVAVEIEGNFVA